MAKQAAFRQAFQWVDALELIRGELKLRRSDWRALAGEAGVSYRWVRYMAAGTHPGVSIDRVSALAEAMGCPIYAIFYTRIPIEVPKPAPPRGPWREAAKRK